VFAGAVTASGLLLVGSPLYVCPLQVLAPEMHTSCRSCAVKGQTAASVALKLVVLFVPEPCSVLGVLFHTADMLCRAVPTCCVMLQVGEELQSMAHSIQS
jgi:hypothetical protein